MFKTGFSKKTCFFAQYKVEVRIDPSTVFVTFDMDQLGNIRQHDWKQRLKISEIVKFESNTSPGGRGPWVNVCLLCAANLSEPLPHYSLFCGQL